MEALLRQMGLGGGMGGDEGGAGDVAVPDTAETIYISSLALLKMLKHGRAGVPMEVMGLLLGEFVDEYTVRCVDVFAMPQSGTTVSVETVDEIYQQSMLDMLKLTGRPEAVVGWYHSHPGFGCWLSGVDCNTQQSFEQLHPRCVAVVVDPIQSVKGKVVIDAFRLINPQLIMMGQEPRQTTSVVGHLQKPSIQALIHGLNRHYYSLPIAYRKNDLEQKMLMNLHKKKWTDGLSLPAAPTGFSAAAAAAAEKEKEKEKERAAGKKGGSTAKKTAVNSNLGGFEEAKRQTAATLESMATFAEAYAKRVAEEETTPGGPAAVALLHVGEADPKKRLEADVASLLGRSLVLSSQTNIDTLVF